MTSRTVNIEATKRKLYNRLAIELGEQPADDEQKPEAPYITVTFSEKRPSYVLPILAVVMEYAKGIATVEHNLGRKR